MIISPMSAYAEETPTNAATTGTDSAAAADTAGTGTGSTDTGGTDTGGTQTQTPTSNTTSDTGGGSTTGDTSETPTEGTTSSDQNDGTPVYDDEGRIINVVSEIPYVEKTEEETTVEETPTSGQDGTETLTLSSSSITMMSSSSSAQVVTLSDTTRPETSNSAKLAEANELLDTLAKNSSTSSYFDQSNAESTWSKYKAIYEDTTLISWEDLADLPDPSKLIAIPSGFSGYKTDKNFTMAYKISGTTVDVIANYNGTWIQTTFSKGGYQVVSEASSSITVTPSVEFINGGAYVQLNYTIKANAKIENKGFAVYADVQIGNNDKAVIEPIIEDGEMIGIKMVDDHNVDGCKTQKDSCTSKDAQYTLYFTGANGTKGFTSIWYGKYGTTYDYYGSKTDKYAESADSVKSTSMMLNMEAGDVITASFVMGVGAKGEIPEWTGDMNPALSLNKAYKQLDIEATITDKTDLTSNSNQWDKLYFTVDEHELPSSKIGSAKITGTQTVINASVSLDNLCDCQTEHDHTLRFWVMNTANVLSTEKTVKIHIYEDGRISDIQEVYEKNSSGENVAVKEKYIDHTHDFSYSVTDDKIEQYCYCGISYVTITATDATYTGEAIENAEVTYSEGWNANGTNGDFGDVHGFTLSSDDTYVLNKDQVAGIGTITYTGNHTDVGTANVTYVDDQAGDSFVASTSFKITKKDLTPVVNYTNTKVYDGDTTVDDVTVTVDVYPVDSDLVTVNYTIAYNSKNTDATTITANVSLTGDKAGNYNLTQSEFIDNTAKITPINLTAKVVNADGGTFTKVYDGTDDATGATIQLTGVLPGEDITATATSYKFNDKNVNGANKVTASGVTLNGTGSDGEGTRNYNLATVVETEGNITKRLVTPIVVLSQNSKTYDGTTTVEGSRSITLSNTVTTDSVSATAAEYNYNSRHVNEASKVIATGITLGNDNGNYDLTADTAELTDCHITARELTPSVVLSQNSKTYDGTTAVEGTKSISLSIVVEGDNVSASAEKYEYNSQHVKDATKVIATGITLSNNDHDDYTLGSNTTAEIEGKITALQVTPILHANQPSKTYDGTTAVEGNTYLTLSIVIGDDPVAAEIGSVAYNEKYVATGNKIIAKNISLTNNDNNDYTLGSNTTAEVDGEITKKEITPIINGATASKVYDGDDTVDGAPTIGFENGAICSGDSVTATATTGYAYNSANVEEANTIKATGIELSGAQSDNYVLSQNWADISGNITAKPLTATVVGDVRKTYDSTAAVAENQASIKLDGIEGTDEVSATATEGYLYDSKNVGTNKTVTGSGVELSGAQASNYSVDRTATGNVGTIEKKVISASVIAYDGTSTVTKDYDGDAAVEADTAKILLSGVFDNDDVTASTALANYSYDNADAGSNKVVTAKYIKLAGNDSANYTLSAANYTADDVAYATGEGKIAASKAKLPDADDLPVGVTNLVYDGTDQTLVIDNYTGDADAEGVLVFSLDGVNYSEALPTGKNADTYTIWYKVQGDDNHSNSEVCATPLTVVIAPREITADDVTISGDTIYNGEEQTENVDVNIEAVTGDIVRDTDYDVTGDTEKLANTDANPEYTVTVTGKGNFTGTVSKTWKINKKSIDPNMYVQQTEKEYDGTDVVIGDTYIYFDNGAICGSDDVIATADFAYDSKNIGTGITTFAGRSTVPSRNIIASNITLGGSDADNYVLSTDELSMGGTITPKTLTPSIVNAEGGDTVSNVWDDNYDVEDGSAFISLDGICGSDDVSATATFTFEDKDAGQTTVHATGIELNGADADNYLVAASVDGKGEITKAGAAVTMNDPSAIAKELTYNASEQELINSVGNANGGTLLYSLDGVNYSEELPKATNADTYTIWYMVQGDSNHDSSAPVAIQATINPLNIANATVTLDDELRYNGEFQTQPITITVENNLGQTLTLTTDDYEIQNNSDTAKAIGNYTLTAAGVGNFTGSVDKAWKIDRSKLIITIEDKEKNFGDEDPVLTYTVVGLQDGDTIEDVVDIKLTRSATPTTGAYSVRRDVAESSGDRVGTYEISPEVLNFVTGYDDTYEVQILNGILTIKEYEPGRVYYTREESDGNEHTYGITDDVKLHTEEIVFADTGDDFLYTYTLEDELKDGDFVYSVEKHFADEDTPDVFIQYDLGGYDADYHYHLRGFNPTLVEGDGQWFVTPNDQEDLGHGWTAVEGDVTWYEGGDAPLSFVSDDELCNFEEVIVNGNVVDPSFYEVSATDDGYIKVTLSTEYLTYYCAHGYNDIQIKSSNGIAKGGFRRTSYELHVYQYPFDGTATPKTGDDSELGLYIVLMLLSSIGTAGIMTTVCKKKFD